MLLHNYFTFLMIFTLRFLLFFYFILVDRQQFYFKSEKILR